MQASLFGATGCARGYFRCDWVWGARRSLWREAVVGLGPTPSSVEARARLAGSMLPSLAAVAPHAHSAMCWVPSNQRLERSVTDLVAGRLPRHTSEDRAERLRLSHAAAQLHR